MEVGVEVGVEEVVEVVEGDIDIGDLVDKEYPEYVGHFLLEFLIKR